MSAFYIDQMQRLQSAEGKELLSADRLDNGKAVVVGPPPSVPDQGIRIEADRNGTLRVTVLKP